MKIMHLKNCLSLIFVLSFIVVISVRAEGSFFDRIKLKPGLVDSEDTDICLGLSFDLNRNGDSLIETDMFSLGYELKGEWAGLDLKEWKVLDGMNTDPIEAKIDLTLDWFRDNEKSEFYLYGSLVAGYEADDRFEEQQFANGVTLAGIFTIPITFELDVLCAYDWLSSFESEQRDALGGKSTDDYGRLQLEALAILRMRKLISAPVMKNFKLSGSYRFFMQNDLDPVVETAGEDEFDYVEFDLAYELWPNGIFGLVQEVFVSYSEGKLPTQNEDQSLWKVGVVFYGAKGM